MSGCVLILLLYLSLCLYLVCDNKTNFLVIIIGTITNELSLVEGEGEDLQVEASESADTVCIYFKNRNFHPPPERLHGALTLDRAYP